MARISIYVPDEMKARMDKAGDINWSEIARPIFLAAMAEADADEHSLKTTGKQGAAGAPPQDEPSAEEETANDVARQLGSMAARMGRVREVPPIVAGTDAAAWLEGYDAEDAKGAVMKSTKRSARASALLAALPRLHR